MKHYLIGASSHAKVILEILQASNIEIGGLYDDNAAVKILLNHAVLGKISEVQPNELSSFILSIGSNKIRQKLAALLQLNWSIAVHPSAQISPTVAIGQGTAIMAGAVVNASSQIGSHCIINTNCTVDHDCSIGNFAHISPAAVLAGNVAVGDGTHVGVGAAAIPGVTIGKWATVGAGSVVIRNVPDFATVVGNPAKVIKYTPHPALL